MAQRTITTLVDDLDQSEADETVQFGLDGVSYDIDLSTGHASELRGALADYVTHARRTGGTRRRGAGPARSSTGRSTTTDERIQNRAIREWARGQGIHVEERGRIPGHITEAYHAQHRGAA